MIGARDIATLVPLRWGEGCRYNQSKIDCRVAIIVLYMYSVGIAWVPSPG